MPELNLLTATRESSRDWYARNGANRMKTSKTIAEAVAGLERLMTAEKNEEEPSGSSCAP
jgi:hypothetical protein